jgi:hypothetical protein
MQEACQRFLSHGRIADQAARRVAGADKGRFFPQRVSFAETLYMKLEDQHGCAVGRLGDLTPNPLSHARRDKAAPKARAGEGR